MNITYERFRKQKIPVLRTLEPLHQFARTEWSLDFLDPKSEMPPTGNPGGLEGENKKFALATGDGGVGSWNLLCAHLENIYKIKKYKCVFSKHIFGRNFHHEPKSEFGKDFFVPPIRGNEEILTKLRFWFVMEISTKNMFRKFSFLFFDFVYIFQVFTQQVSAPNSTLPGG